MATGAARLKRKNPHQGGKRKTDRKRKTDLTLTGLLMEGLSPNRLFSMSDQDEAIAGQSDFFRKPFPLIYAIFELFQREQTPFSYRHMVSVRGRPPSRSSG